VYYSGVTSYTGFADSTAAGGIATGGLNGSPGSVIFVDDAQSDPGLSVYQQLSISPDTIATYRFVTVDNGGTLTIGGGANITVTGMTKVTGNSSILVQSKNNTGQVDGQWQGAGATLNAGEVQIDAGSKVSADGQGYTGVPCCSNPGNGPGGGPAGHNAGSYGGIGGGPTPAPIYGSAFSPADLGSGGSGCSAWWCSGGGSGGGAIRLAVSGTLTNNGTISANGGDASSGAGAGGSVYAMTGKLAGSGVFTANGGGSGGRSGSDYRGGGGGRVAVYYPGTTSYTGFANSTAAGGIATGGLNGSPGSVIFSNTPQFIWLKPVGDLLHDTERMEWAAHAVDIVSTTVDLIASSNGLVYTIGSHLNCISGMNWDTRAVPDGRYELRIIFRDENSLTVGEAPRTVLINNSVLWHSGLVQNNETWTSDKVHLIEGTLIIPTGVHVTIEPGTVIKAAKGGRIIIQDGGILDALGTDLNPIVFTSLEDDSAGGDTNLDGNRTRPAPGGWFGIVVQGSGQFNSNENIEIRYLQYLESGTISINQIWLGSRLYHVTGDVTVPSGVTLTIQPGAIIKFDAHKGIVVQPGGQLIAGGTVAEPIYFTSIKDDSVAGDTNGDGDGSLPAPGDWRWIRVEGEATFDHVYVAYGGGTSSGNWDQTGMIRSSGNGTLAISRSFLRESRFDGILAWSGPQPVTVTDTVITGTDRGICAHPGSTVRVLNCTLDDNRVGLLIHGGAMEAVNSIVSNSLSRGVLHDYGPDALTLQYSNVWAEAGPGYVNYDGTADRTGASGNISADPKFKGRGTGNFRLNYGSPCIDAADTAEAPDGDFMGAPRYDDPRTSNTGVSSGGLAADMGAFEFVETAESNVDLILSSVTGPSGATAGQAVEVTWTVTNVGSEPFSGSWHDEIALVDDFSSEVPIVLSAGEVVSGGVLGPGENATFAATVVVPGGTEGFYLWRVHTNSRGEVFEGINGGNNLGSSESPTELNLPELKIGEPLSGLFEAVGRPVYFKVRPESGRDVVIRLDRADVSGWTQMFLGCGKAPTEQSYCGRSPEWNEPDASVPIENASGGWYYVMLLPKNLPSGAALFTLHAAPLDFAFTSIGLKQGSNLGKVTIPVHGAKFRKGLRAFLIGSDLAEQEAASIYYENSTLIFATFDLRGLGLGNYDVKVLVEGVSRTLNGAFDIVTGARGNLRTRILAPENVRTGRSFTAWIEYRNEGHTDLLSPIVLVESPSGSKVKLFPEDEFVNPSIPFLAIGMDGPAGILRPGASGRVPVYVLAEADHNEIVTKIGPVGDTTPMNWNEIKAALRPDTASSDWDATWAALVSAYGNAVGDYVRMLSDAATLRVIRTGERTHSVRSALVFFILDKLTDRRTNLSGYVYLDDPLHPVGRATVVAVGKNTGAVGYATSTADGLVRFENLPEDTYTFYLIDYLVGEGPAEIAISSGSSVSGQAWIVKIGGTIAGKIEAPEGVVFSETGVLASEDWGNVFAGRVGKAGNFTVTGLPDGTYKIDYRQESLACTDINGVGVSRGSTAYAGTIVCTGTGNISGLIRDKTTEVPLKDIVIGIDSEENPRAVLSGPDGKYLIKGLKAGRYNVSAYGVGYRSDSKSNILVVPGQTTANVHFEMFHGGILRGTVMDGGTSGPVSEALVSVMTGEGLVVDLTQSDLSGQYSMTNLPSGSFKVKVEHNDYFPYERSVSLGAGETTTADVELSRTGIIYGNVVSASDGSGLPGIALYLLKKSGPPYPVAITNGSGEYHFDQLLADDYVLMFSDGSHRRFFSLAGSDPQQQYTFTLSVGSVKGKVLQPDGITPVGNADVSLVLNGHDVLSVTTSLEGEFVFPYVVPNTLPETYGLEIAHEEFSFDVVTGLSVTAGQQTVVPDVLSGNASVTLTFVSNSSGLPVSEGGWARLALVRAGVHDAYLAWKEISTEGVVQFSGVVPGAYRVENILPEVTPAESLISIGAGENTLSLNLSPGATFVGTVQTATSEGIGGMNVILFDPATGGTIGPVVGNRDGSFSIHRIPSGTYHAVICDMRESAEGDRYGVTYLPDIAFGAAETVTRIIQPAVSHIAVSGSVADLSHGAPTMGTVEAYDQYGLMVIKVAADGVGDYRIKTLGPGTYKLLAYAEGYSRAERTITVVEGDDLRDTDLSLEWKGVMTPYMDAFSQTGGLGQARFNSQNGLSEEQTEEGGSWWDTAKDWLSNGVNKIALGIGDIAAAIADPVFNNSFMAGINQAVQRFHGRPERRMDVFLPDASVLAKCPKALAWRTYALTLDRLAEQRYQNWLQLWEASWTEHYANTGMLGVYLAKFAGQLAMLEATYLNRGLTKANKILADEVKAAAKMGDFEGAKVAYNIAMKDVKPVLDGLNKWYGVSDTTGKIIDRGGLIGAFTTLFQFPTSLNRQDIDAWLYNMAGFIGTANGLLQGIKRVQAFTEGNPALQKVSDMLGPVADGLQLLFETYNLIVTDLDYIKALENAKEEYDDLIDRRNEAAAMCWAAYSECHDDPDHDDKDDNDDDEDVPSPPSQYWPKDDKKDPKGKGSEDPNIKITVGAGNEGFIGSGVPIFYTIYFENKATATAPAQQVIITDHLSGNLDWSTVELVSVGFNNVELSIPTGSSYYATTSSVATDPNPVRVEAGLNAETGVITWVIESVDLVTHDLPEDPLAGFLPPNGAECGHCGEGYVSFWVWPRNGLTEGSMIKNKATIVFDINPPLDTNEVTNTIDSIKPTSNVIDLPPIIHNPSFSVAWTGSDHSGGSGIGFFDIYASVDGGPFSVWLAGTTETSATYDGIFGHTYGFYNVATDRAGNRQDVPSGAQAMTGISYIEVNVVLLHENFAGGIPDAWLSAGKWSQGGASEPCGGEAIGTPFASPWAIVDSSCGATHNEELYTPVFDASLCKDASLYMSNRFKYETGTDGAIEASINGGDTWENVATMTSDEGPSWKEMDLGPVAGAADAQLVFHFSGTGGFWAVDNVWALCREFTKMKFVSPVDGDSGPQSLLISNKGPTSLNLSSIAVIGADSGDFSVANHCPATLESNQNCSVDIVFSPSASGSKTAALTIHSDDVLLPVVDVALEGSNVLSLINPVEGTLGSEITLKGTGYGAKKGKVTVGGLALKILEWTSVKIRGSMSKAMSSGGYPIVLQAKDPKGVGPVTVGNFEMKAPEIVWMDKYHGVTGDQVSIIGKFFGTKKGKVLLGTGAKPKSCKVVSWTMNPVTGNGQIVFVVPKGLAKGAQELEIMGKVGTATGGFTVD
jgi:hypothetical protein